MRLPRVRSARGARRRHAAPAARRPVAVYAGCALVAVGLVAGIVTHGVAITPPPARGAITEVADVTTPAPTTPPTCTVAIGGTAQFKQTLTATASGWPDGTTYTWSWSLDGTDIGGATNPTFAITDPALVGHQVTVSVIASQPCTGDDATQATSATIAPAPMPTGGFAYVGGAPSVGHTWLARTAGWPQGSTFTYQWLLDGQPISGATAQSYVAPGSTLNHRIGFKVFGIAPGYAPARSAWSPALRVQVYNPLAGELWGTDAGNGGNWDSALISDYLNSTGDSKALIGKIATRPRATWFGAWMSPSASATQIRNYIAVEQAGTPRTLVQMSLFSIYSVAGGEGNRGMLTQAQVDTYKSWYNAAASAIGTSRVAIVMEPDLELLMNPGWAAGAVAQRESLVSWAVQLLAKNPNAAIYLDAGDSDWHPSGTASMLKASGIQYARGFALGATHYAGVGDGITWGTQLLQSLANLGIGGKHVVIDTADNGRPFTWQQYHDAYGFKPDSFDNAYTCVQKPNGPCDTLGVAPTWQVGDTKVSLTSTQRTQALANVDGYLWFGRPWLVNQSSPYDGTRARQVASTTPY